LETLAGQVAAANASDRVTQLYDQYLNFIVTEDNLFSCGIPGVYRTLNDPSASETAIEEIINRIVSSLFSVAVTMGNSYEIEFNHRHHTYNTLSTGKRGRNDLSKIG